MKKNELGFSAVEGLLVLIIAALIGFVGWFVWHSNNSTKSSISTSNIKTQQNKASSESNEQKPKNKTYTNSEYGFSFEYPENWTLADNLKDIGRGSNEGEVIITSPSATKVYLQPNQGGKGGDCWDDQANARTTRTCSTRNIISFEKLANSTGTKAIYFYKASMTKPTMNGGGTSFYVFIGGPDESPIPNGSEIGAFITYWAEIKAKGGNVGVKVEGKDDDKNQSAAFFETQEVKEATPVLKSFKLLN